MNPTRRLIATLAITALVTACGSSSDSNDATSSGANGGSASVGSGASAGGGGSDATGGSNLGGGNGSTSTAASGGGGGGGGNGNGGGGGSAPADASLFGAAFNPHDADVLATLTHAWGGVQIVRSYGKGPSDYASKYLSLDVTNHAASNFSFKLLPKEVLAGMHDAEIKAFFQAIPDNHPTYWTYWHEPDDEIYKTHTFTAPDYRAAWKYIRKLADAAKATRPNLKIWATLIIMEYSMRPTIAPSRPLLGDNGMYPGDDVIEIFGVDAYNESADSGGETDPDTQFGKVLDFAKTHGKPWAIGEFGSCKVMGDPDGRAKYITAGLTYMQSKTPPVFVEWFDVDMGNCDYRMETDSDASTVWKKATTQGIASF